MNYHQLTKSNWLNFIAMNIYYLLILRAFATVVDSVKLTWNRET